MQMPSSKYFPYLRPANGVQHKLLELPRSGADSSALEGLVAACSPATFGKTCQNKPTGEHIDWTP